MNYDIVKWLHVLSAAIIFGTGIGSAFFMFMANWRKNVPEIYFACRHAVVADWLFTLPSVLFQLISGLYLVHVTGYRLTDRWLMTALCLYFLAGICWLPVVWIQIKMRDMAKQSLERSESLPAHYWNYNRWWIFLGSLAFPAVSVIFWLMVAQPDL